jgi:predicted transcriptional regulator
MSAALKTPRADRSVQSKRGAAFLKLASHRDRVTILLMLLEGEKSLAELWAQLGHTKAAVSHHLSLMRLGRLITTRREGKGSRFNLTPTGESLARFAIRLMD